MQDKVVGLLRDVVRGFRRQCVADWTAASQRAIGALLQRLGDHELDIVAQDLAALRHAFRPAKEQGRAGHAGSPPC